MVPGLRGGRVKAPRPWHCVPGAAGSERDGEGSASVRCGEGAVLPVSAERCPGAVQQQVVTWGSAGSRPWLVPQQCRGRGRPLRQGKVAVCAARGQHQRDPRVRSSPSRWKRMGWCFRGGNVM